MSFTESSSQASDEEQIILVLNPVNNEPEEVVVSGDNTLELSTLDHAFPGAYGLKFINKSSNRQQYVNFDENKKAFLAPRGGWKGTTFNLVFKDRSERKGHLYKQVEKKPFFSDEPDHLPSFEYMQKFLFYIKEENFNTCVTCVGSRFFVTYQHNTHRTYKDADSIRVYSYDGTTVYDTVVCFIDEKFDLILLESSTKILDRVPISKDYKKKEGSKLKMIGKSSEDNTPCCVYGYLGQEKYYRDPVMRGSFMVGKMDSSFVECGTPVFDMHGLYGIYIARLDLFDSSYEYDVENDKYFEILILPVGELNVYMGYIRSQELAKYGLGPPQGVLVLDGVVYS